LEFFNNLGGCAVGSPLNALMRLLVAALALVLAPVFAWRSGALATSAISIGVIEYNAKASQGGWTLNYGDPIPLPLQIDLIANKINDASNPDPVQFIALVQAGDGGARNCVDKQGNVNDYLISCALAAKGLKGWTTIISACDDDQTQLAYSADWTLVANTAQNPLVDGYQSDDPTKYKDVCWADLSPVKSDHGRPYNIAYFQHGKTGETVLFVIVHMPHGYPDDCQNNPCPYGNGKFMWDVPQFKSDVRSVVGPNVDLKKVRLLVTGDMNSLGEHADPKLFAPIFDDFGAVKVSEEVTKAPDPTCCADDGYMFFFDRIVTNSSHEPSYEPIYLTEGGRRYDYPLNKKKFTPSERENKEHKATYGVADF
jgi:hypothetical protein